MIKEAYCSFEIAKLLKEKGFKESTQLVWYEHLPSQNALHDSEIGKSKRDYFYWEKEGERNSLWTNNSPIPSYISGEVYSCPTHQMAMAWLREVHNKHCDIGYDIDLKWFFQIIDLKETVEYDYPETKYYHAENETGFNSYEETVEAALKYSLENLI